MRGRITCSAALLVSLLVLLGPGVSSGPADAATQYTVTDLGTLGGATSDAYGINASGQVVGTADTETGPWHAFLWENGVMHDLGTLGGAYSTAYDINDSGQVVGESNFDEGWDTHGFLWEGGPMSDISTLGWANGINASGQVVGGNSSGHACVWDSGVTHDLGTAPGDYDASDASAINDSGLVVGVMKIASGHFDDAFLWDGAFHILPSFGGSRTYAKDINASGQVVGSSETPDWVNHAVLWEGGIIHDLGTLGGAGAIAAAINTPGQVVGRSHIAGGGPYDYHAFLWESGVMLDLNDLIPAGSGWVLRQAADINDRGQIVGKGLIGGQYHAFLLTPIPEPSALVLLGLGFLVVMRRLRRG